MTQAPSRPVSRLSRRRRLLFRFVAVLLGLLPFVILELVLMAGGWGEPDLSEDPFVGFTATRPLFELNEAAGRYEIAPSRQDWFYPDSFVAEKPANGYRIFCIGDSTVAGRPFTIETAFSSWLKLFLEHHDPERAWEVVNCGGVSYATYRMAPIVDEVLGYAPDLLVLYAGHNEFLEDRTYAHVKSLPEAITKPYAWASRFRTFNVARRWYQESFGPPVQSVMESRPILKEEVDALLEHKGGMEHYVRDPEWRARTIEHFGFNMARMLNHAERAGVPVIVMNPASNLRGVRPFKSEHRAGITEEEKAAFKEIVRAALGAAFQGDYQRAAQLYEEALQIDAQHADTLYETARAYDVLAKFDVAYRYYVRAKDEDICPLRMLEPMHAILREVADHYETPFLDSRAAVKTVSKDGIPGNDGFLDHVHPNPAGHQFLAKLIIEKMAQLGIVKLEGGDWLAAMEPAVNAYLQSLPDSYWREGEQRLENLRQWALGNSQLEPEIPTKRNRLESTEESAAEP